MKILFPTYGGGHVKSIIPIAKKLIELGHKPIILGLTTSIIDLENAGVPFFTVSDFLHLFSAEERTKIYNLGVTYSNGQSHSSIPIENTIDYIGINIFDLILNNGDDGIDKFINEGRSSFFPIDFSTRLLKYLNPDKVFVTCGKRMEKAIAVAANRMSIKTIRLIDLLGESLSIEFADTVCVMNEIAKNNIIKNNPHVKNVVITGNPNFDMSNHIFHNENMHIKEMAKHYDLPVISFFSQPGIEGVAQVLTTVKEMLNSGLDFIFVFKPHPNENIKTYEHLFDDDPFFILLASQNPNDIINQSDLVITFFSSVGFQAIFQGKPLVTLNFNDSNYGLNYNCYGCSILIESLQEFQNNINNFLNGELDCVNLISNYYKLKQPSFSVDNIIRSL